MQIEEETQPIFPLPATLPVFVESDFTQGWPEVLMSYSHGSALLFNTTELQIISIKNLLSYFELLMEWDPAVLLKNTHLPSSSPLRIQLWIWPNITSPRPPAMLF